MFNLSFVFKNCQHDKLSSDSPRLRISRIICGQLIVNKA